MMKCLERLMHYLPGGGKWLFQQKLQITVQFRNIFPSFKSELSPRLTGNMQPNHFTFQDTLIDTDEAIAQKASNLVVEHQLPK